MGVRGVGTKAKTGGSFAFNGRDGQGHWTEIHLATSMCGFFPPLFSSFLMSRRKIKASALRRESDPVRSVTMMKVYEGIN